MQNRLVNTKKQFKRKHKIFSQSYVIDAMFAKKHLDLSGFHHVKLDNPILYRGDERSPDIIFKEGFYRRIKNNADLLPSISATRASFNCIACTKDVVHAVGFADHPHAVHKAGVKKNNKAYGWVYMLYAESGIDLAKDELYKDNCVNNVAKSANEVSVTGVPSECILAAFQIKTTNNDLRTYYEKNTSKLDTKPRNWQLLVTDYAINEKCILKDLNPNLYETAINDFLKIQQKGYYRIPWSPYPEETDFLITHDLSNMQKNAYREFGLTKEEAKKIDYDYQIEALKLHLSAAAVINSIKSTNHLLAYKVGADLSTLASVTPLEAYGLSKGLCYDQVRDLPNTEAIDAIRLGFTREELLTPKSKFSTNQFKFDTEHFLAVESGCPIEIVRKATSAQAYGLKMGLSLDQLKKIASKYKVEGMLLGFTRTDVLSPWFSEFHLEAIKEYSIESLRGKTQLEVFGITNGLAYESVQGLSTINQVKGIAAGYTREDVLSTWYIDLHLSAIAKGFSPDQLRQLPRIEISGLLQGLTFEEVKGLKDDSHIKGILAGFKKEDVLSTWYCHPCLLGAQSGNPIDEIREKYKYLNKTQTVKLFQPSLSNEIKSDENKKIDDGLKQGFSK